MLDETRDLKRWKRLYYTLGNCFALLINMQTAKGTPDVTADDLVAKFKKEGDPSHGKPASVSEQKALLSSSFAAARSSYGFE